MCSAPAIGAAEAPTRRLDIHRSSRGRTAVPTFGRIRQSAIRSARKKGLAAGALRGISVSVLAPFKG